ncbi:MAG TPA: arabinan endo-1,5-alpha-L-arabinosidase [Acidobacteriaceae bacterium]
MGFALVLLLGCQSIIAPVPLSVLEGNISFALSASTTMSTYPLTGATQLLHDPSVIRQGNTYYVFTSDWMGLPAGNYLPMRCSQDEVNWTECGSVFSQIPAWVQRKVPGATALWAPDISYFNGQYHVYYAGSTAGSQRSVIGLATNTTLDSTNPAYKWVDAGEVLESAHGDDFNAIDPNIAIDASGSVWMTFGSYWSGIKQIQIDPQTGLPVAKASHLSLATRPGVSNNPIEGASIVRHGAFYYLFVSVDYCCNANPATDNYKEMGGRSSSPQGPFVDSNGVPMLQGGGTVILEGEGTWNAPGGGTAYVDPVSGESLLVFHALKMTENGTPYLWAKQIQWQNDWPGLM